MSPYCVGCRAPWMGLFLAAAWVCGLGAPEALRGGGAAALGDGIRIGFEASDPSISQSWEASGAVDWVDGYRGRAPRISKTDASLLVPLGSARRVPIDLTQGSLRFRFRPDWSTGEGPGHWASFVSVGVWTPDPPTIGFWALGIDPTGTQITFSGQAVGAGKTYLRVPFRFQAQRWYDILLVYSPVSSRIYVDGVQQGPGNGVTVGPSDAVEETYGLRLGNNHRGNQPIRGAIDEFEYSTDQQTGFVQRRDRYSLEGDYRERGPSVALRWNGGLNGSASIKRRRLGQVDWEELSPSALAGQLVDHAPELRLGEAYEYVVDDRQITVSVGVRAAVEDRGRVLLVVADNVASKLTKSIERYRADLIGDGWSVEIVVVPPDDMRRRSRYQSRIARVKSLIDDFYRPLSNRLQTVVLIGNVPVPYSGYRAEDGHRKEGDDHRGAWPCDAYYGDTDGTWTDEAVDHINLTYRTNSNRPGDGKFDQDYLPSPLELAICRIDFSNLPAITGDSLPEQPRKRRDIEIGLLRQYFEKNHRYRQGQLSFANRGVYKSYLPPQLWGNMDRNAFRNSASLFGTGPEAISNEDCFLMSVPVRWAFIAGYGGRESIGTGRYRTAFLNQPEFGPQAAFVMLYASWSGDWNLRNSFTKSLLVKPETGLAAMSSIHGQWDLSSMALGVPLARALLQTTIDAGPERRVARSISILGDATLRMDVVPPVKSLKGEVIHRQVRLSWRRSVSEARDGGCHVYRSKGEGGPYRRISGDRPVMSRDYIDTTASTAEPYYMVRQLRLESTPAGQYINMSQGQFWNRSAR